MTISLVLECLVFFTTVLVIYIYKNRQNLVLSWKLPGPIWLPFIGNAYRFIGKNEDVFDEIVDISNSFPSPMRFWLGPKMSVIIKDPYNAQQIMTSSKFAQKDDNIYRPMEFILGKSLITGSGMKWKRDRKLLGSLFLPRNFATYYSTILHHTLILRDKLGKKVGEPAFNVECFIQRGVADFVNESLIGMKTDLQSGGYDDFLWSIKTFYDLFFIRLVKLWLSSDIIYRFSSYWENHNKVYTCIQEFFGKAVKMAQEESTHDEDDIPHSIPLVKQIIEVHKKNPEFATQQELIDHLVTLYLASEDTITVISSFTLVLLGMYPDIQEKVFNEIINVIGKNRNVEEYDLPKLIYLEMVLKDILRLFPIGPLIIRKSQDHFSLDNNIIPKGCSIVVAIYSLHRDETQWEKPNEFYPEHFTPEAVAKRHPYAYMPFSAGQRACVGKFYAIMSLKIILATILQSFRVEADGKLEDIKLRQDISIRKKDNVYPVRLYNR